MNAKLETLKIEALGKFGVKSNGVWYGTKRPLAVTDFVSGATYTVLVEPWTKGDKSGMNIVQIVDTGNSAPVANAPTSGAGSPPTPNRQQGQPEVKDNPSVRRTKNGAEYVKAGFGKPMTDFEIELDARISYAGLLQAAVQSPALAVLPVKSNKDIANAAIEIADALSAAIDKKLEGK
jgi:hypothetical protein